jgi:hypothetical protein
VTVRIDLTIPSGAINIENEGHGIPGRISKRRHVVVVVVVVVLVSLSIVYREPV